MSPRQREQSGRSSRRHFLQQAGVTGISLTSLGTLIGLTASVAPAPTVARADDDSPYVIAQPCIGAKDAACVAVCPVECIYEGEDQYYINPNECISCGACEPECPVEAIFAADYVPEQWASYIAKNRDFFGAPHATPTPVPR
jgi:ferredoxin